MVCVILVQSSRTAIFLFHLTMSTLFCWIIFEPSCAGSCFTVVRLVLVAGARRHTGYMEEIALEF